MVECILCRSSKEDDVQYGDMLQKGNMAVHTFCLYLAPNLAQNGEDDEGFLGFLEADIKKESKRVSYLYCCYCGKNAANVGCCTKKCRRSFHFICGLKNGAENQFCGSYQSFCHEHVSKSKFSSPPINAVCVICYDNLLDGSGRFSHLTSIQAPCCQNGWFHKLCLQRSAKIAGYFFKCPLCNDAKIFRQKLLMSGIFIPNQDAAWELEPNAFADLLERPNECIARDCSLQNRTRSSSRNPLIFCIMCGSKAMHKRCIPYGNSRFHCPDCTIAIEHEENRGSFGDIDDVEVCNVAEQQDLEILRALLPSDTNENEEKENIAQSSDLSSLVREVRVELRRTKSLLSNSSRGSEINVRRSRRKQRLHLNNEEDINSSEESIPEMLIAAGDRWKEGSIVSTTSDENFPPTKCVKKIMRVQMSNEKRSECDTPENQKTKSLFSNSSRCSEINIGRSRPSQSFSDDVIHVSVTQKRKQRLHSNNEEDINSSEESKPKMPIAAGDSWKEQSIISISSDEKFPPTKRIKEIMSVQMSDKEKNECGTPENQIKLHSKCDKNGTKMDRKSGNGPDSGVDQFFSSEESDDDPLENFTKFIQKQSYSTGIAQRSQKESNEKNYSKLYEGEKNKLDTSCIARRTRHRSMYSKSTKELLSPNDSNSIFPNVSKRSKRQTICSQTRKEKSKDHIRLSNSKDTGTDKTGNTKETTPSHMLSKEMSQIYGKVDNTEEEDDGKREHKENKLLEISCIANRTRKRLSVKLQNVEEDEPKQSPRYTRPVFKSATDVGTNVAKRLRRKIVSNSSDDTENVQKNTRKICKHAANENWPNQNYEMAYYENPRKLRKWSNRKQIPRNNLAVIN